MEFRILGPLEVLSSGRPVGIPGVRQQKLLALLILSANQMVSDGRLVGELWDNPPPSAKQQIHNAIGSLRRRLAPLAETVEIVRGEVGYRLEVSPECLDSHIFARAISQARSAKAAGNLQEALECYREGLDLWRGSALAGLHGDAISSAAANLDEQRLAAIDDLVSLRLRTGEAAALIGELRELVATHPLRESLRGQLMQALHLDSRQADALAVYDEGRRLLAEEFGIDPSPQLRQLHEAILKGELALGDTSAGTGNVDEPHPGPAPGKPARRLYLPHDIRDFSGRSAELAHLLAMIRGTSSRTLVISAIDGMGGIGKTALAVHLAHQVADEYPDGQYFVDLHGFSPGMDPISSEQALESLLRDSGLAPELIPLSLEARQALWRSHMAGQKALLVLDNAIDAEHVRPLLPSAGGVLVLVTSRRKLPTLDSAIPVSLDLLPQQDAITLFNQVLDRTGDTDAEAVATVVDLCGRLPLAIRIAAARLRSRPVWTVADLAERLRDQRQRARLLEIDDRSVLTVLQMSYRHLQPDQQRVFRLLGAHPGNDFDAYLVSAVTGLPLERAEDVLESLLDDNLVKQHTSTRFYFHDLVKDCAHRILLDSADRVEYQTALERLLDYYLHSSSTWIEHLDKDANGIVPEIQHKPEHVREVGSSAGAVEALNAEYGNLLSVARFAAEHDWHRHAWQLPCVLQPLLRLRNNFGGASTSLFEGALRSARILSDRRGELACHLSLAAICRERKMTAEARNHVEEAIGINRDLGDLRGEAALLVELGNLYVDDDHLMDGRDAFIAAKQLLAPLPTTSLHAATVNNLGVIYRDLGDFDLALDHLHHALTILADDNHPRRRMLTSWCVAAVFLYQGEYEKAKQEFERVLEESTAGAFDHGRALALLGLAEVQRSLGSIPESIHLGRQALSLARRFKFWKVECEALNALGEANFAANDYNQAQQVFHHAQELAVRYGSRRYEARALEGLAHLAMRKGQVADAKRLWEQAVQLYPSGMVDAGYALHHLSSLHTGSGQCPRCTTAEH